MPVRIWIYGRRAAEADELARRAAASGMTPAGTSLAAKAGSAFPRSGLTPAVCAAMRGDIDGLLVPSLELLGKDGTQIGEVKALFGAYGVWVRSASSRGSSSS